MSEDSQWQGITTVSQKFYLEVSYKDNVLKIRLMDFADWNIYEKSYQKDVVSNQIHKKVDLIDIFNILAKSEESMQKNQMSGTKMQGIKIKKHQKQSYKVESQGKLTVYLKIQSNSSAKPLECTSILQLTQQRKMTNMEIWAFKQIQSMKEKHQEQKEQLRMQNSALLDKVKERKKKPQNTSHVYRYILFFITFLVIAYFLLDHYHAAKFEIQEIQLTQREKQIVYEFNLVLQKNNHTFQQELSKNERQCDNMIRDTVDKYQELLNKCRNQFELIKAQYYGMQKLSEANCKSVKQSELGILAQKCNEKNHELNDKFNKCEMEKRYQNLECELKLKNHCKLF